MLQTTADKRKLDPYVDPGMGGGAEKSHNFIVSWQYLKIIFTRGREHMQAPSGKERGFYGI